MLILAVAGLPSLCFASAFPEKVENRHLYDEAGLLASGREERIENYLRAYEDDHHVEMAAVTVASLKGEPLGEWTNRLFEKWKVGGQTHGRGLLFVLAAAEEEVRLEVGYALEALYPDGFIAYIEQEQMKPYFEKERLADGFEAALELIIEETWRQRPVDEIRRTVGKYLSGGAGARAAVDLSGTSEVPTAAAQTERAAFGPQATPEEAFGAYLERARLRIRDTQLGLFTPESCAVMKNWVVTSAQLDLEYKQFAGRPFKSVTRDGYAVLKFPEDREGILSPFFLRKGDDGWQIDLAAMMKAIRFNTRNQWRLVSRDHPYAFAFED